MAYPHKWSPISYKSSVGQRKHIGQRPMLYRWTTPPAEKDAATPPFQRLWNIFPSLVCKRSKLWPSLLKFHKYSSGQIPLLLHHSHLICFLHWLKSERIEYKLLSLTYKVLTATNPPYLHKLISVQPPHSTRSSSLVTLARPPTSSSLRITRSFR